MSQYLDDERKRKQAPSGQAPKDAGSSALSGSAPAMVQSAVPGLAVARRSVSSTPPPVRRAGGLFGRIKSALTSDKAKEKADQVQEHSETAKDTYEVPSSFVELAGAIHTIEQGIANQSPDVSNVKSFAEVGAQQKVLGTGALLGDTIGLGSSLKTGYEGIRGALDAGDSFDRNDTAVQIEGAARGVLTGGGGVANDLATLAVGEVPVLGAAVNFVKAGDSAKGAVEDSVASARLGMSKGKIKHVGDKYLEPGDRETRLKTFRDDHAALQGASGTDWIKKRMKLKGSDLSRFQKTVDAFHATLTPPVDPGQPLDDAELTGFLHYTDQDATWAKDFGSGSKARGQMVEKRRGELTTGKVDYNDFDDAHSLGKVASFGQRRKGEMATMKSIDAVGNAVDGVGSLTAGADFGATKGTGKAIKAGKALYEGTKKLIKRGRRVHKLRTAKNAVGYGATGGQAKQRGVAWGAKQFFFGNLDKQMEHTRDALNSATGENTGGKKAHTYAGATGDAKAKMKWDNIKLLTKQCDRRIDDLLRCLGSDKDKIFEQAKHVLKVIAETNLAGAIAKLEDNDIDEFRTLYQKVNKGGTPGAGDADKLKSMSDRLRKIVSRQLAGIGG